MTATFTRTNLRENKPGPSVRRDIVLIPPQRRDR